MGVVSITILLVIGIISAIILFYKKTFSYWSDRGIKHLKPSIPLGNVSIREHMIHFLVKVYNLRDNNQIVGGYFFWKPIVIPTSLDLIQNILIRDFNSFHERGFYSNESADPLSAHMFSLDGEKWKSIRSKLSPTFTSGKMKIMFHTVAEVAGRFNETIAGLCQPSADLEIKDLMARFTTDVIGTAAFGIECNSLKDPNVDFRRYGKMGFEEPYINPIVCVLVNLYPELGRKFNVRLFSKEVNNFFLETVRNTIDYREKNKVQRNDFMDLLIQLKNDPETKLSLSEIVAQGFLFFVAGFDTSASAVTFALYELALNPDVQQKARQEIQQVLEKHAGKLTYDSVKEMAFIDQIITESLRKYPPAMLLMRKVVQDYQVPNTDKTIEKGTLVFIPTYAIHHDAEIYPNPEAFVPDRFAPDQMKSRHPMSFLSFGDGPRNCIGMRFGRMQSRVGLITLLKNYRFEPCSNTKMKLDFDLKSGILTPVGGLYLKVEKL